MSLFSAEVERLGFTVLEGAIDEENLTHLTAAVSALQASTFANRRNGAIYGVRNLLNLSPPIREFSQSTAVAKIAKSFLGEKAKVVRAIYFDKNPNANWKVPWHQDLTIAVREKREAAGFSAWTMKAGIQHVQPPVEILQRMLTLRFHLDDADESNGALRVIPGSHRGGRLSVEEIKNLRRANKALICRVKKGDCLIMRPLLLHSSSAAAEPKNRRVIHFELAAENLPNNLQWYDS
jgi:ectoine hydroxylase-related dioxygenase (phytanoyl-CoA dioxygenase family)